MAELLTKDEGRKANLAPITAMSRRLTAPRASTGLQRGVTCIPRKSSASALSLSPMSRDSNWPPRPPSIMRRTVCVGASRRPRAMCLQ